MFRVQSSQLGIVPARLLAKNVDHARFENVALFTMTAATSRPKRSTHRDATLGVGVRQHAADEDAVAGKRQKNVEQRIEHQYKSFGSAISGQKSDRDQIDLVVAGKFEYSYFVGR